MTKVQLQYDLLRPLDEQLMEQVARVHGVYGIVRVTVPPSSQRLIVEYDASRLTARDVENVMHRAGLPIAKQA